MSFYGFKTQLRAGDLGEIIWLKAHQKDMLKLDGFKADFKSLETGETYELKTDYYDMNKTPNFFLERFSDMDRKTPGGPWQAQANGITYFAYFFVSNLTYFIFDTGKLVKRLNKIIKDMEPTEVKNKTWVTLGYRVPRELLEDIYRETTLTVSITHG